MRELTKRVIRRLSNSDGESLVTLFDFREHNRRLDPERILNNIDIVTTIENFKLTVDIQSIEPSGIPDLDDIDSDTEIALKVREFERNAANIGLEFLSDDGISGWTREALILLQNRRITREERTGEYYIRGLSPFIAVGNLELLGEQDRIGVRILNMGSGILFGDDYVTVKMNFSQKIYTEPKESLSIPIINPFGRTIPQGIRTTVSPQRTAREILAFSNTGTTPIWYTFGTASSLDRNNGVLLLPGGSFNYVSNGKTRLNAPLTVLALDGPAQIAGEEAYF